jgi:hypothetical protein
MRKIALLAVIAFAAACGDSSTTDPGTGYLRVGNLSPDLGPFDFCVAPTGTTTYTGPVMAAAGANGGLVFGGSGQASVSKYFAYTAGTYDVKLVAIGGSCSSTALLTRTGLSLGDGAYKLLAAVGFTGSTTAPHALTTFTDETTVAAGSVAIRFANVGILPGATFGPLPAIDVGVTIANVYSKIFTNVAYPGVAASGVDANGYAVVPASNFTGSVDLTVCPNPLTPASGFCQSTTVPAGSITGGVVATAYVIGVAGTPPNALLCGDNTPPPAAGYQFSLCTTALAP